MPLLEGFDDDTGRTIGSQERATQRIIADLNKTHPDYDPILDGLCESMLSLAQNIDTQKRKGREISRNMAQYIDALWKIRDMYPTETVADDDVEAVWNGDADED